MKIAVALLLSGGLVQNPARTTTDVSLAWPSQPDPAGDTEWIVSVTIQEKWEEKPTRQFTLSKTGSGYEAWTKSVAKPSAARAALDARSRHFTSTSCTGLKEVGAAFEHTRISPIPQGFMSLHPNVYRFWVATRYSRPREIEFLVPDGSYWGDLGENPPALVAWLKEAHRIVSACGK